jgi:hypothetical protein
LGESRGAAAHALDGLFELISFNFGHVSIYHLCMAAATPPGGYSQRRGPTRCCILRITIRARAPQLARHSSHGGQGERSAMVARRISRKDIDVTQSEITQNHLTEMLDRLNSRLSLDVDYSCLSQAFGFLTIGANTEACQRAERFAKDRHCGFLYDVHTRTGTFIRAYAKRPATSN